MKKPTNTTIIVLALIAFVCICWNIVFPSGAWRYRTTVRVETPEGIISGSAVREVEAYYGPRLMGATQGGHAHLANGEAVVVNLGKRGVLFALMRGDSFGTDYGWGVVYSAFRKGDAGWQTTRDRVLYYRSLKNAKVELTPEQYPEFVYFKNLNDQRTVRKVKDFEGVFGAGVKLKDVTVEMTDDPVTWEVVKWLKWLPARKGVPGYFGYEPGHPHAYDPTGLRLSGGEFSKGKYW
ncbi:MAG: hypothetical protein ACAH83_04555 [Alphaproteobacteria bacterium]